MQSHVIPISTEEVKIEGMGLKLYLTRPAPFINHKAINDAFPKIASAISLYLASKDFSSLAMKGPKQNIVFTVEGVDVVLVPSKHFDWSFEGH